MLPCPLLISEQYIIIYFRIKYLTQLVWVCIWVLMKVCCETKCRSKALDNTGFLSWFSELRCFYWKRPSGWWIPWRSIRWLVSFPPCIIVYLTTLISTTQLISHLKSPHVFFLLHVRKRLLTNGASSDLCHPSFSACMHWHNNFDPCLCSSYSAHLLTVPVYSIWSLPEDIQGKTD